MRGGWCGCGSYMDGTSPMTASISFRRGAVALAVLLCLVPASARGRGDEALRAHHDQGMRLYRDRQYTDAIEEFEAAYALRQLPRLLYNIARSYFQLGRAREALE